MSKEEYIKMGTYLDLINVSDSGVNTNIHAKATDNMKR